MKTSILLVCIYLYRGGGIVKTLHGILNIEEEEEGGRPERRIDTEYTYINTCRDENV